MSEDEAWNVLTEQGWLLQRIRKFEFDIPINAFRGQLRGGPKSAAASSRIRRATSGCGLVIFVVLTLSLAIVFTFEVSINLGLINLVSAQREKTGDVRM